METMHGRKESPPQKRHGDQLVESSRVILDHLVTVVGWREERPSVDVGLRLLVGGPPGCLSPPWCHGVYPWYSTERCDADPRTASPAHRRHPERTSESIIVNSTSTRLAVRRRFSLYPWNFSSSKLCPASNGDWANLTLLRLSRRYHRVQEDRRRAPGMANRGDSPPAVCKAENLAG
ncbi:hypothetical protein T4A_337 [Trichinella pseudospiralis]|uniref:Uncharacterized protein n=1 Tax=Trichinella pseudospiralis TaxID=6337 RepID=A0A0V1KFP9_TRIPS|nr:hypothetical protein T4A_337 [Trichinella pseudospiralis]KRZ46107.1 hypothetical protein T4C_12275 [Trichinella pseudospiralis]